MKESDKFELRELKKSDIELIADYWLKSEDDFLISMGVDLNKLPTRKELIDMLSTQISLPNPQKSSLALILELNNKASGHCNVTNIIYGKEANMHLHLWDKEIRRKGLGTKMVLASIPVFFERLKLKIIWCEPYAKNSAPNRTLENTGFEFVEKYITTPGSLNFEQEVNKWKLTKTRFERLYLKP